MKRAFITLAAATAFLLADGYAMGQFVQAQQGQGQSQGQKGKRQGPADGSGNQKQGPKDGSGNGAKSGKSTGPQDGSGPIHDPQGGGQGRRGRR